MKATPLAISGVVLLEPKVFEDERGFFLESFNQRQFEKVIGQSVNFLQDNHSKSSKGVLRGLHFQYPQPQEKLVRVTAGAVFDVAVDIRKGSATFGQWVGEKLTAENKKQLWIPKGFAHGFLTLEDNTEFLYKCTDYYAPQFDNTLMWNDPDIGIEWPEINVELIISKKDKCGRKLNELETEY